MARHDRAREVGHVVLAVDRALTDPLLAAVLRKNARTPQWLTDQIAAANTQARGVTSALVAQGAYTRQVEVRTSDIPDWARLGAFTAYTEWVLGQGSTCMHAPHHLRPQPVFAGAWRPGLMVCGRCVGLLALRHASERDRTCDACGHVVAGVDGGEPIYSTAIHIAEMTYNVGACPECRWSPPR